MKKGVTSSGKRKTYHFLPAKYGRELLLDIGRIEKIPNFNLGAEPHQLSFYEILFLKKGSGYFTLDDHKIPLRSDRIIFTSPGHIRSWHIQQPVSGYALYFEKDFLNRFFTDELFLYRLGFFHQYRQATSLLAGKPESRKYEMILADIEHEIEHLQTDSPHLLRAFLYQLLVLLNRSYSVKNGLQGDLYVHPVFFRFRSLVEIHYQTYHRVVDYLQLLQVSAAQLNKLCKQHTGVTAQQMIHDKQVAAIKQLLSQTDDTVAGIAYQLQFSDPSNFNRFFRNQTGLSPQQYREQV